MSSCTHYERIYDESIDSCQPHHWSTKKVTRQQNSKMFKLQKEELACSILRLHARFCAMPTGKYCANFQICSTPKTKRKERETQKYSPNLDSKERKRNTERETQTWSTIGSPSNEPFSRNRGSARINGKCGQTWTLASSMRCAISKMSSFIFWSFLKCLRPCSDQRES